MRRAEHRRDQLRAAVVAEAVGGDCRGERVDPSRTTAGGVVRVVVSGYDVGDPVGDDAVDHALYDVAVLTVHNLADDDAVARMNGISDVARAVVVVCDCDWTASRDSGGDGFKAAEGVARFRNVLHSRVRRACADVGRVARIAPGGVVAAFYGVGRVADYDVLSFTTKFYMVVKDIVAEISRFRNCLVAMRIVFVGDVVRTIRMHVATCPLSLD